MQVKKGSIFEEAEKAIKEGKSPHKAYAEAIVWALGSLRVSSTNPIAASIDQEICLEIVLENLIPDLGKNFNTDMNPDVTKNEAS